MSKIYRFQEFNTLNESKKNDSIKWYHGSDHKFTTFNSDFLKSSRSSVMGIFATDDKSFAEMFGENVYEVKVTYNNPKTITHDKWYKVRGNTDTQYFLNWRNELIADGYDSLFVKESTTALGKVNLRNPNIIIIFDPKHIEII